jgi:cytochrome c556
MRYFKIFNVIFLILLTASFTVNAQQFTKAEDAIKYRKNALYVMDVQYNQLKAMAQGKATYDAKSAMDTATVVEVLAKLPWAGFGEGTDKGETKAKPEIWSEPAKFKEAQEKFIAEASKLATAAKTGKLEDLKVAVSATNETCKNCHSNFKSK